MSALLVFSTAPDRDCAERIAAELVGRRLAACVSLVPGLHSVYRWQGQVESAAEVMLLIKTTHARLAELQAALVELHPFEVPELIAIGIEAGLPAYLDWLQQQTAPA